MELLFEHKQHQHPANSFKRINNRSETEKTLRLFVCVWVCVPACVCVCVFIWIISHQAAQRTEAKTSDLNNNLIDRLRAQKTTHE